MARGRGIPERLNREAWIWGSIDEQMTILREEDASRSSMISIRKLVSKTVAGAGRASRRRADAVAESVGLSGVGWWVILDSNQ